MRGLPHCLFGLVVLTAWAAAETPEQTYLSHCALCHQPTGQGAPPVYPPLAGSDWLRGHRAEAIKAICEGLSGELPVNGVTYNNVMPAQILDDAAAAGVLNYVLTSWGNGGATVTGAEVAAARATTKFPTFAALQKSSAYPSLPTPPKGWTLREAAPLPEFCTRLAGGGDGDIFALAQTGTIYGLNRAGSLLTPIIPASEYLDPSRGSLVTLGIARDSAGRLWIVSNQQIKESIPYQNEITIYRTSDTVEGVPAKPKLWFRTHYPYGIGTFNHGVSHMAFGPDGMLYVSSGSRTDGGEPGRDDHYFQGGEVDITACLWRLDPSAAEPKLEVFARGLRNAYGYAWDATGRLFSVSNGPDASAPEEMDCIERGKHYGFPYQFSNWPVAPGSPYAHTPPPPPGLEFSLPVSNLGPAGGGRAEGLSTFDPHSSPAGMIWCGADSPAPLRNGFLVTRFGNLLGGKASPVDVGFDLLFVQPQPSPSGGWQTRCETILAPLGRPIDIIAAGHHSAIILEYTRPTNFKEKLGWLPGRLLELAPVQQLGQ